MSPQYRARLRSDQGMWVGGPGNLPRELPIQSCRFILYEPKEDDCLPWWADQWKQSRERQQKRFPSRHFQILNGDGEIYNHWIVGFALQFPPAALANAILMRYSRGYWSSVFIGTVGMSSNKVARSC
jgi:hypothetical protein